MTDRIAEVLMEAEDRVTELGFDYAMLQSLLPADSPIEHLLAISLVSEYLQPGVVWIPGRMRIGPYNPDFVCGQWVSPTLFLVLAVEADGHDFHERTKEQAERDRKRDRLLLRKHCVPTLRFTGSEVWRDPFACAKEVTEAFNQLASMFHVDEEVPA